MPRSHLPMRKMREILRLKLACGRSHEEIARSIKISVSTVSGYLRRAQEVQLKWPLPEDLTDGQLEELLHSRSEKTQKRPEKEVDWQYIHTELKRKSVTLMLLWNEYKEKEPEGLSYSQFCHRYHKWKEPLEVWMKQPHKAGEKLFVDYAGQTMPVLSDAETGEIREAQIFIAVLGVSNFTYAEGTWTQTLSDWISSHINAFEYMGGCPEIMVPDNLKSGVTKSHLYEPDINPTYQDMARHYGAVIIPARPRKPQDKSRAENGVLYVERFILARLRNRSFLSLFDLNQSIRTLLEELNQRPFQKLAGSRSSQFEEFDKPALKSLPVIKYEYAEWKKSRVGFNYHVEIERHFYSVPFALAKKEVHIRYTPQTVEIFYEEGRIASHVRSSHKGGYTTRGEHMPPSHKHQADWTPEKIKSWAQKTGGFTEKYIDEVMKSRPHPEQGFKSCLGILRLGKSYGNERLEGACRRALHIGTRTYKSIESILKNNLDLAPLPISNTCEAGKKIQESHEYIRGKNYFK